LGKLKKCHKIEKQNQQKPLHNSTIESILFWLKVARSAQSGRTIQSRILPQAVTKCTSSGAKFTYFNHICQTSSP
jgi:hypothetical protein